MDTKTKIILGILVIALIILAGYMVASRSETIQTNANNKSNVNEIVNQAINEIQNEVKNEIKDNTTQNEINNVVENNEENDIEESVTNETNGAQTGEDDRQKAIDMARQDWGNDSNVTFKIDEQTEDGKFVVSVVDKNTTKVIFWYSVDVKNNTIEEK